MRNKVCVVAKRTKSEESITGEFSMIGGGVSMINILICLSENGNPDSLCFDRRFRSTNWSA